MKNKINKIIISVIASAEVLTLFPLLFFGFYQLLNSQDIKEIDTTSLFGTIALGIVYMAVVLLTAFKAIQNLGRPKMAYAFLGLPLIIVAAVLLWNHY